MKTVLIVDDEKLFLASLTEGLQTYADEFAVVTALNGREAVKILHSHEIALVITDLKMPVMDGFQLLAYMIQSHAEVPVIVMTAFGTPEIEDCIMKFDACGYMEKPIDFQVLTDKIRAILNEESSGHLSGITLPNFLQLLQSERKTCTLDIATSGKRGTLYFSEGELIDAESGKIAGEPAALEIASWTDVEIDIIKSVKKRERRVTKPLSKILLEALHRQDSAASAASITTSPTGKPKAAATAAAINTDEAAKPSVSDPKPTTPANQKNQALRKDNFPVMANNLNESIGELMGIDGAMAVALVDSNSGMALGTAGNSINLDVAAAGNSEVVKCKMKVMGSLGLKDKIEDILISLGQQYHLIRPLSNHSNLFFYLVLDRAKSNLAMARFKLSEVENRVEV